jgi:hypothetical protein
MFKLLRIFILIGIAVYVGRHNHIGQSDASTPPAVAQSMDPVQVTGGQNIPNGQVYFITQDDAKYIQSYWGNVDVGRAAAFGKTTQSLNLPSGAYIEYTIQKTQTGWCTQRNEPTFSISFEPKKPFMLKN